MPDSDDASTSSAPARRMGPLPVIALVVALAALGVAGWAAFKPRATTDTVAGYTDAQRADAKAKLCAAADQVRKGVSMNTNLEPPGGEADVTGALAVAANARISLSGGGQYLLAKIDPAAPQPLSDDARAFANTLLDIGAASIAGALNTDPDQAARLKDADGLNTKIVEGCK
jgi:hypothetical protein